MHLFFYLSCHFILICFVITKFELIPFSCTLCFCIYFIIFVDLRVCTFIGELPQIINLIDDGYSNKYQLFLIPLNIL
jgi:hypothetical protein